MTYRVRHPELHQEEDVVPSWKVGLAIAATLALSAVMIVLALTLIGDHEATLRPSGAYPDRWLGPRHMVARVREDVFGEEGRGASLDAEARAELASYGWVDEARGIVRIPIARAIDLVAAGRKP
jgi:hypothetical protein